LVHPIISVSIIPSSGDILLGLAKALHLPFYRYLGGTTFDVSNYAISIDDTTETVKPLYATSAITEGVPQSLHELDTLVDYLVTSGKTALLYLVVKSVSGPAKFRIFEDASADAASGTEKYRNFPAGGFIDADNGFNATNTTGWNANVYVVKFSGLTPGFEIEAVELDVVTAVGAARVKVYDEVASEPTNLLAESAGIGLSIGIKEYALLSHATVPANGIVWVGFEVDSASADLKYSTGQSSGDRKGITHTFGDGPDPFGTPSNSDAPFWCGIVGRGPISSNFNVNEIVTLLELGSFAASKYLTVDVVTPSKSVEIIHAFAVES